MAKLDLKSAISKNVKNSLNNTFSSTENIKQQIIVLEELRAWIPAPTQEEDRQLEVNIVANGCRDALTLWETTHQQLDPLSPTPYEPAYVLVDGHNRYRICKARNIGFNIQLMDFADLKSVKDFMIDLQLGRRNLTPQQVQYFRGLRYLNEKSDRGKYDRIDEKEPAPPESKGEGKARKISTAEKLAREYKVGKNTIIRDAEFAAGVERLTPEMKQSVLSGEVKVDKGHVQKLGKMQVAESIASVVELETIAAGDQDKKGNHAGESKQKMKAQAELTGFMQELLAGKPLTRTRLDQLVEKANALKQLLN